MNDYIKLYEERRKKKLKEIELAKKKFYSLNLVERNAYEQIIERNNTSWITLFFYPIKLLFYYGLFYIVVSLLTGVGIETFRQSFISLSEVMVYASMILFFIGLIMSMVNESHTNKLKLKLLR